jgi:hypothetical protein
MVRLFGAMSAAEHCPAFLQPMADNPAIIRLAGRPLSPRIWSSGLGIAIARNIPRLQAFSPSTTGDVMKDKIDEALKETFPASDKPSHVGAGAEKPSRSGNKTSQGLREAPVRQSETPEGAQRKRKGATEKELDRIDEQGAHERAKG